MLLSLPSFPTFAVLLYPYILLCFDSCLCSSRAAGVRLVEESLTQASVQLQGLSRAFTEWITKPLKDLYTQQLAQSGITDETIVLE